MATMTILRGPSGSGKSTYGEENFPSAIICSADHYMVNDAGEYEFVFTKLQEAHRQCFMAARGALEAGYDVVVDNTNTQLWEMSPYVMLANEYRAEVEIVRLECSPEEAAARNVHGVPANSVKAMARRMERLLPFWPKEKVVQTGGER